MLADREKNGDPSKQKKLGNMYLLIVALEGNVLLSPILQKDYKHHDSQERNHQEELQTDLAKLVGCQNHSVGNT